MSARATSLRRIARPSSVFRFKVTLRTPRLLVSKYVLGRFGSTEELRELSPPSGTSILITSAPRSAISMYGTVPACAVEHVTTLTPCKGPCGSVMSDLQMTGDQIARRCSAQHWLLQRTTPHGERTARMETAAVRRV